MPGTLIAMARINRPSLMIYGGTIKPGHGSLGNNQTLDIVSAFQSYGESQLPFSPVTSHHACGNNYLLPTSLPSCGNNYLLPALTIGWQAVFLLN